MLKDLFDAKMNIYFLHTYNSYQFYTITKKMIYFKTYSAMFPGDIRLSKFVRLFRQVLDKYSEYTILPYFINLDNNCNHHNMVDFHLTYTYVLHLKKRHENIVWNILERNLSESI